MPVTFSYWLCPHAPNYEATEHEKAVGRLMAGDPANVVTGALGS